MTERVAASGDEPGATPPQRDALERIRVDLLLVHRTLLQIERIRYERVHGRVANNSAFLQLVINDAWFEWLRPMAQMVLLIDERTSDKKQRLTEGEAHTLIGRGRALLRADADGDPFQQLYHKAVLEFPEFAVLAAKVAAAHA